MTSKERRSSERVRCRFACAIRHGRSSTAGTVVDLSSGGLAIRADGEVPQGEAIEVEMEVPGRGTLSVEAIVWHVRRARHRDSGDTVYLLGTMLSKAPDDYFALARGRAPGRAARATEAPASTRTPRSSAASEPRAEAARRSAAAPSPTRARARTDEPLDEIPHTEAIVCDLTPYRIRLKHRASPRTRVVTIDAASVDEARAIAHGQLGTEWEVLEAPGLMRA